MENVQDNDIPGARSDRERPDLRETLTTRATTAAFSPSKARRAMRGMSWWTQRFADATTEARFVRWNQKTNLTVHISTTALSCVALASFVTHDMLLAATPVGVWPCVLFKLCCLLWHLAHLARMVKEAGGMGRLFVRTKEEQEDHTRNRRKRKKSWTRASGFLRRIRSRDGPGTESDTEEEEKTRRVMAVQKYYKGELLLFVNMLLLGTTMPVRLLTVYHHGDVNPAHVMVLEPMWSLPNLLLLMAIMGMGCYRTRFFYSWMAMLWCAGTSVAVEYFFHPQFQGAPFFDKFTVLEWFVIFAMFVRYIAERMSRRVFFMRGKLKQRMHEKEIAISRVKRSQLAKAIAESVNTTRQELIGYIFHEVRVPLNSIALGLYSLLKCGDKNRFSEEDTHLLELMEHSSKVASKVFDDVINMQSFDEEGAQWLFESFDVCEIVDRVAEIMQPMARKKEIQLSTVHKPGKIPWIVGDETRVQQVVTTFLDNAIAYTDKEGKIWVKTELLEYQDIDEESYCHSDADSERTDEEEDGTENDDPCSEGEKEQESDTDNGDSDGEEIPKQRKKKRKWKERMNDDDLSGSKRSKEFVKIRVSVIDTGIGVSKEDRKKLFTPYVQIQSGDGKLVKKRMKTGLGLSICARLIKSAGGRIGFTPLEQHGEKGSKFWFELTCPVALQQKALSRVVTPCTSSNDIRLQKRDDIKEREGWVMGRLMKLMENERKSNDVSDEDNEEEQAQGVQREPNGPELRCPTPRCGTPEGRQSISPETRRIAPRCDTPESRGLTPSLTILPAPRCGPPRPARTPRTEEPAQCPQPDIPDRELVTPRKCLFLTAHGIEKECQQTALIVEDNFSSRKLLRNIVQKRLMLHCHEAKDGLAAVNMIKQDGPDRYAVIFMDKEMPIMNGCQATTELRRLGVKAPIIAVTGCALQEDVDILLAAGCDETLTKPLKVDTLLAVMKRFNLA